MSISRFDIFVIQEIVGKPQFLVAAIWPPNEPGGKNVHYPIALCYDKADAKKIRRLLEDDEARAQRREANEHKTED